MITHPTTGEIIPDVLDDLVEMEKHVDYYLRSLGPHYEFRRELRARIAELRGPAELPQRRYRTDVQNRVSECPRCGQRL